MKKILLNNFQTAQTLLTNLTQDETFLKNFETFCDFLIQTVEKKGIVFTCGNGGSHCDALHFAEELTGRFCKDRIPLGAIALGEASHVTCTANDFGYDYVFERQIHALGREGDLLIGLTTSGNSPNVLKAFERAKSQGLKTVGLLGKDGGKAKDMVDVALIVPSLDSGRCQEVHIKLIHTVIECMERKLFPQNY